MAIKITAGGKIITKGGLPSCTCCGCSPDVTEIWVEVIDNITPAVVYLHLLGSANDGYFNDGDDFITWDAEHLNWDFASFAYGNVEGFTDVRCDPSAIFSNDDNDFTVSLTELP